MKEMMEGNAEIDFLEFADLPFRNQDIAFSPPDSVVRVRQEVQEADGICIFSPGYNYQPPRRIEKSAGLAVPTVKPKRQSAGISSKRKTRNDLQRGRKERGSHLPSGRC